MYYTLGQRQGLTIGGPGEPWYVAGKDRESNRLIVVQGRNHPALWRKTLRANDLSWIAGEPPRIRRLVAKTRYRQADAACVIDTIDETSCTVVFDEPQWAVTPGQSVVFYDGERCLGGGVIQ